jgi:hypothetical protein
VLIWAFTPEVIQVNKKTNPAINETALPNRLGWFGKLPLGCKLKLLEFIVVCFEVRKSVWYY